MRQVEYSDPPRTPEQSSFAFVLTNLPYVKKKTNKQMEKKKKCDKPSHFAASLKTVYASPCSFLSRFVIVFFVFFFLKMKQITLAPRFAFEAQM